MGWGYCGKDLRGRQIGYCINATCDARGCNKIIDHGLGCICGEMHNADTGLGCGRYYCDNHLGSYGPRGGCSHRGKNAWGIVFCQLMVFAESSRFVDGKWQDARQVYGCACDEWRGPEVPPAPHVLDASEQDDDRFDQPQDIAGYTDHVRHRAKTLPDELFFSWGASWPAQCIWCHLVTEDPDAHFGPDDLDPEVISESYICYDSPTQMHSPLVR